MLYRSLIELPVTDRVVIATIELEQLLWLVLDRNMLDRIRVGPLFVFQLYRVILRAN